MSGFTTITVTTATLVSIVVGPINRTIAAGLNQQYVALGTYTDGSIQPITTQVTWTSSAPTIATISNGVGSEGLAKGLALGTTTITATSGAITGSTTLNVTTATLVSIQVTPTNPAVPVGIKEQFVATGT